MQIGGTGFVCPDIRSKATTVLFFKFPSNFNFNPWFPCWKNVKVILREGLLFYNLITLLSLVMSMNDDHVRIGILIVLPLFDGWGESAFPILICLIPELAPTAYMFVYLFWSTISIPAKWPSNVNRTVFSSLPTWSE